MLHQADAGYNTLVHLFFCTACTGIQEVALLRSKLESLHIKANEAENIALSNEHFCEQLKICCGICEEAYCKLGEEHRRHADEVDAFKEQDKELKQKIDEFKQIMEEIEQGR